VMSSARKPFLPREGRYVASSDLTGRFKRALRWVTYLSQKVRV
jgi:hypothetical protein